MAFIQTGWQVYDATGRRKYLTAAERRRFLAVADRLTPELRALCYVLAFTGARISEALSLAIHQLDSETATLTLRTLKRRRLVFRTVPIPTFVVAMLLALPKKSGGRFWQMHRVTAWRRVRQVMHFAGVAGPMATCKGLRHGYAIGAATASVPAVLIQRWMGHASPVTTAIYLDAVGVEEREFAERMWT